MPKKIVYLFGSGATQGVLTDIDPTYSLVTADIRRVILGYPQNGISNNIWNELGKKTTDIEHLISILERQYNYTISEKLRGYYHKALVALAKQVPTKTPVTLYTILSDLHLHVPQLQEELLCYMTLNYENILEKSIESHLEDCDINYEIQTMSTKVQKTSTISVIKLHGSFSWINERPIDIRSMVKIKAGDTIWIPPGVEKKKEDYPFNLLWGKATEFLMKCDTLRVIGCSLSRNDWGLIPILYAAQKFIRSRTLEIEIIDFVETGKAISDNYKYLNIKPITEIEELLAQYKRQLPKATNGALKKELRRNMKYNSKGNPFKFWLDAKIEDLVEKEGVGAIDQQKAKFLYKYYRKV